MKEDLSYKFWREYIDADILKRDEKLKNIVNKIDELFKIDDAEMRKHCLLISLKSYFDDLIEYMESKNSKD